ncbi:MAG TPA: UDP-galactopyranose mutase, partial [Azospirillaceae bacterium]|nr:UDP-galactopyranose mutase [Azospirillaceae bacterium]
QEGESATLELYRVPNTPGLTVAAPRLPPGADTIAEQRRLLDELIQAERINDPLLWYYTPASNLFSDHLRGAAVIYDCMDELTAFKGASPELREYERRLLARADLVFTGGQSLYEAKCHSHDSVHCFPSSVDVAHFGKARLPQPDPDDQAAIPHPRLGFFGVIDERMDTDLLDRLAGGHPDWHFVMIGPVVKISPEDLPRHPNIHYLGGKDYTELPSYVAGWDVALMPFANNEATRFISPTKTPEYLAAGKPVVSSPIVDVVRHYGRLGLVDIGSDAASFASAIAAALDRGVPDAAWLAAVDDQLERMSWDSTYERMAALMVQSQRQHSTPAAPRPVAHFIKPQTMSDSVRTGFDYLIVGAGFAGSVLAERLAAGMNKRVLLIDRRWHIGGNAFDAYNEAGILVHRYGPHIFHTNSQQVWSYLSRFTRWRPYEHRVAAQVDGHLVPIPINLTTINRLYGLNLDSAGMERFLAERAVQPAHIRTSEDVVLAAIGPELYQKFFRGYTRKQWGLDPSELDKAVTARIPTRTNTDDRYFTDLYQAMPLHGYTRMFENMLDHPNIKIMLNTDYREVENEVVFDKLIFTGPIDEFFDHRFGPLPYRSLKFRHVTLDQEVFQPAAVVNYPSEDVPYTRITEYKYLTGQAHAKTSLSYELPCAEGDPYYPIPRPENAALFKKYQTLADQRPDVLFVGRLATYRYYNMDQVVGQALAFYQRIERDTHSTERQANVVSKARPDA